RLRTLPTRRASDLAHGDAAPHLVEDEAARAVGYLGLDLHAAVDGAGMEDDGTLLQPAEGMAGQAEEAGVLAGRGKEAFVDPFRLDAQEDDRVRVGQARPQIRDHLAALPSHGREHGLGPAKAHRSAPP